MLDPTAAEALTRSLMLGSARQPIPVERAFGGMIDASDPKATLKVLALLAQRNRFRRLSHASSVTATSLFPDARRPIPVEARTLFLSLVADKVYVRADVVGMAIADAMARNHVKVHPFDLPRVEQFARAYCDELGVSALAWMERHANKEGDDRSEYSFFDTVDETNWTQARPAQKGAFIWTLRKTDPTRARALVEGSFKDEQAAVRVRLLKALAENLSSADIALLESAARDRAPSVRETAEELLARIPGTAQSAKCLQECMSRITLTKSGLLRRRSRIQIEFPATAKDDSQRWSWAAHTFGAIPLDDFANALGLAVEELVAAATDDDILIRILAIQAERARRYDVLTDLVRRDPKNAWLALSWGDGPEFGSSTSPDAWSAAVLQPDLWTEMPDHLSLLSFYQKLRAPLAEATARNLLASKAWRRFLDDLRERQPPVAADTLATIAALTPPSLRPALRADLAPLAPELTARALNALSLLDHIDAA